MYKMRKLLYAFSVCIYSYVYKDIYMKKLKKEMFTNLFYAREICDIQRKEKEKGKTY